MKFYLDLRWYLESAYTEFEGKWWLNHFDLNKDEVLSKHWIDFNHQYRKMYKPNYSQKPPN